MLCAASLTIVISDFIYPQGLAVSGESESPEIKLAKMYEKPSYKTDEASLLNDHDMLSNMFDLFPSPKFQLNKKNGNNLHFSPWIKILLDNYLPITGEGATRWYPIRLRRSVKGPRFGRVMRSGDNIADKAGSSHLGVTDFSRMMRSEDQNKHLYKLEEPEITEVPTDMNYKSYLIRPVRSVGVSNTKATRSNGEGYLRRMKSVNQPNYLARSVRSSAQTFDRVMKSKHAPAYLYRAARTEGPKFIRVMKSKNKRNYLIRPARSEGGKFVRVMKTENNVAYQPTRASMAEERLATVMEAENKSDHLSGLTAPSELGFNRSMQYNNNNNTDFLLSLARHGFSHLSPVVTTSEIKGWFREMNALSKLIKSEGMFVDEAIKAPEREDRCYETAKGMKWCIPHKVKDYMQRTIRKNGFF